MFCNFQFAETTTFFQIPSRYSDPLFFFELSLINFPPCIALLKDLNSPGTAETKRTSGPARARKPSDEINYTHNQKNPKSHHKPHS